MTDDRASEKVRLIFELDKARRHTLDILKDADEQRMVYPASGWRVKEMVAHILIWEEEALAALRARQNGQFYRITEFGSYDIYNARAIERYRETPFEEIKTKLHTIREEMKTVLLALPPEHFTGMIPYPWPWMGSLSSMIEIMAQHEFTHSDEIRRALAEGK